MPARNKLSQLLSLLLSASVLVTSPGPAAYRAWAAMGQVKISPLVRALTKQGFAVTEFPRINPFSIHFGQDIRWIATRPDTGATFAVGADSREIIVLEGGTTPLQRGEILTLLEDGSIGQAVVKIRYPIEKAVAAQTGPAVEKISSQGEASREAVKTALRTGSQEEVQTAGKKIFIPSKETEAAVLALANASVLGLSGTLGPSGAPTGARNSVEGAGTPAGPSTIPQQKLRDAVIHPTLTTVAPQRQAAAPLAQSGKTSVLYALGTATVVLGMALGLVPAEALASDGFGIPRLNFSSYFYYILFGGYAAGIALLTLYQRQKTQQTHSGRILFPQEKTREIEEATAPIPLLQPKDLDPETREFTDKLYTEVGSKFKFPQPKAGVNLEPIAVDEKVLAKRLYTEVKSESALSSFQALKEHIRILRQAGPKPGNPPLPRPSAAAISLAGLGALAAAIAISVLIVQGAFPNKLLPFYLLGTGGGLLLAGNLLYFFRQVTLRKEGPSKAILLTRALGYAAGPSGIFWMLMGVFETGILFAAIGGLAYALASRAFAENDIRLREQVSENSYEDNFLTNLRTLIRRQVPVKLSKEDWAYVLAADTGLVSTPEKRKEFWKRIVLKTAVALITALPPGLYIVTAPELSTESKAQAQAAPPGEYKVTWIPVKKPKKTETGGGGGGGERNPLPPSKGRLPRFSLKAQLTPPAAVIRNPNPRLPAEPTLVVPPNIQIQSPDIAAYGDPLAGSLIPSGGPGSGGGIGTGPGGGIGSGTGPGLGPGWGGGYGGGVFQVGGDVSEPTCISCPEPQFTEEARKAKHQGMVVLLVVVRTDGGLDVIRVLKGLGMGLDEKATETVKTTWKFKPSERKGKPVPVYMELEVLFNLY
ncbi:MAG: energy transducer TonB [Elusimicrobia bacterium]|nr:energy transducer TonB [Elusimicrobiota bacterium]